MNIKYKWLYVFLAINIFSVVYYILYFIKFNHTPAPFLYDKDDTFMDFLIHCIGRMMKIDMKYGNQYTPVKFFISKVSKFNYLRRILYRVI